jgi:hypothetical protein
MKQTDYPEWPFEKALRTFSAQREELLGTLAALTPDEWELSATVTSYGRASERTLRSYAAGARRAAAHERRFAEPALWSAGAPLATRVPADRAKSAAKSIEWRYEGT